MIDEMNGEFAFLQKMYEEEERSLTAKLENMKQFHADAMHKADEKERCIPELAFMAQHVEEEVNKVEQEIIFQNEKLKNDAKDMRRDGIEILKRLDRREDAIEERQRVHEKEIEDYDAAAGKKRDLLTKVKDYVEEVADRGKMEHEEQERELSSCTAMIECLNKQIASQREDLAEIKRKKSWKKRFMSIFRCCTKKSRS